LLVEVRIIWALVGVFEGRKNGTGKKGPEKKKGKAALHRSQKDLVSAKMHLEKKGGNLLEEE